jgi:hypothetical protein
VRLVLVGDVMLEGAPPQFTYRNLLSPNDTDSMLNGPIGVAVVMTDGQALAKDDLVREKESDDVNVELKRIAPMEVTKPIRGHHSNKLRPFDAQSA